MSMPGSHRNFRKEISPQNRSTLLWYGLKVERLGACLQFITIINVVIVVVGPVDDVFILQSDGRSTIVVTVCTIRRRNHPYTLSSAGIEPSFWQCRTRYFIVPEVRRTKKHRAASPFKGGAELCDGILKRLSCSGRECLFSWVELGMIEFEQCWVRLIFD